MEMNDHLAHTYWKYVYKLLIHFYTASQFDVQPCKMFVLLFGANAAKTSVTEIITVHP